MSEQNQRKLNQFFASFIAKLRKWLIKVGSPFRISRRFVRSLLNQSTKKRSGQGGFVLPTVVMVTTVVTLLVVVMVARSSERAKTAANTRVEEAFRSASTPALERARAKISELINDPRLPAATPTDSNFNNVIEINLDNGKYTFADEIRLQLYQDLGTTTAGTWNAALNGQIDTGLPVENNRETASTVWKFPIDTDGNGRFDSFSLYSILFRTPVNVLQSSPTRSVSRLESRTRPMDESALTSICTAAVNAGANVAGGGWIPSGNLLKKSFFVYAATVPITQATSSTTLASVVPTISGTVYNPSNFEFYTGNQSFNAIELQQDRSRTPLNNNAVWFEGDIELARTPPFKLNGRVFTNSNLMVGSYSGFPIDFYQVSDPESCYYKQENSKIVVGGNVVEGDTLTPDTTSLEGARFHLFKGAGAANNPLTVTPSAVITIDSANSTVNNVGQDVAFNDSAYNTRINLLVQAAFATARWTTSTTPPQGFPLPTTGTLGDPQEVVLAAESYLNDLGLTLGPAAGGLTTATGTPVNTAYNRAYTTYFKKRLRKIPFKEVNYGANALGTFTIGTVITQSTTTLPSGLLDLNLEPPAPWRMPPDNNAAPFTPYNATAGRKLPLGGSNDLKIRYSGTTMSLPATQPAKQKSDGKENLIGDRVQVGNNLPALWLKNGAFVGGPDEPNYVGNTDADALWDDVSSGATAADKARYRTTQVSTLVDLGDLGRSGSWERDAADDPSADTGAASNSSRTLFPITGGLRVITGAGIYERKNSFLPAPPRLTDTTNSVLDVITGSAVNESAFPVVWPDLMPMSPGALLPGGTTAPTVADTPTGTFTPDIPTLDPNTPKGGKGDLRMRATALYHYKTSTYDPTAPTVNQTPIACVSSYYDPTNSATARNFNALPFNNATDGKSNNGVVYPPPPLISTLGVGAGDTGKLTPGNAAFIGTEPTSGTWTDKDKLIYQANLVFPNGRFVNAPLRTALTNLANGVNLSLGDQSAVHSALCALQILAPTPPTPTTTPISGVNVPHGAIKEASFLDAREAKSITRSETAPVNDINYDLEIEQRQPLEIRATDLDMNLLRGATVAGGVNDTATGVATEYLLPYSGLVYASRDDALRDLSDNSTTLVQRELLSPTDFRLDPTRRPNAIRLINGQRLWRGTGTTQPNFTNLTAGEKGLVLATNLPVYIKGNFNLHTQEEFNNALDADWGDFYTRNTATADRNLNRNFACRPNSSANCTTGDQWRAATILSDASTIVSSNSVDGFRDQGDFDLRNNAFTGIDTSTNPSRLSTYSQARKNNGFYNNNYVTSANWLGAGGTYPEGNRNTYLANGVTPVQRRLNFPEYGMEMCRKLPLFACQPSDWVKSEAGTTSYNTANNASGTPTTPGIDTSGTPRYIDPANRRYARRFSFLRYDDIYGDGNESLVMVRNCAASTGTYSQDSSDVFQASSSQDDIAIWPMPIGVTNGKDKNGFTYPQVMGGITADSSRPFASTRLQTYGDVGCPPNVAVAKPTVEINQAGTNTGDRSALEGRMRNQPSELVGPLPKPVFSGAGINVTAGADLSTTDNSRYRQFNFRVTVNSLNLATGPITVNIATDTGSATQGVWNGVSAFPTNLCPPTLTANNTTGGCANTSLLQGVDYLTTVFSRGVTGGNDTSSMPALGTPVTTLTFDPAVPARNRAEVTVLVVRDSADENQENFRIRLTGLSSNAIFVTGRDVRNGNIQIDTGVASRPASDPNPLCPATPVIPAVTGRIGDDRPQPAALAKPAPPACPTPTPAPTATPKPTATPAPTPTPKPTPTPAPTPTPKPVGMLQPPTIASVPASRAPMAAMLPAIGNNLIAPVAAAYPSNQAPSSTATATQYPQFTQQAGDNKTNDAPPFCLPTSVTTPPIPLINAGLGTGTAIGNCTVAPTFEGGGAPPTGTAALTKSDNTLAAGFMPMLPGMNSNGPSAQNGTLWYRTSASSGNWLGESWNTRYDNGARPWIASNYSFGGTSTTSASPLSPNRLVVPNTLCISTNTADGGTATSPAAVDCGRYVNAASPTSTATQTGVTNLNLPINTNLESASNYAFCGFNGTARRYQIDVGLMRNGTDCPSGTQTIINDVYTKLAGLTPKGNLSTLGYSLTADRAVNVYDVPATGIPVNTTLRLTAGEGGTPEGNPIFVLRLGANPVLDGLRVILKNVSPNNIFWVVPPNTTAPGAKLTIQSVPTPTPTPVFRDSLIVGNFITSMSGVTKGTSGNSTVLEIRDSQTACDPSALAPVPPTGPFSDTDADLEGGAVDRCVAIRGARFLGFEALPDQPTTGSPPATFRTGVPWAGGSMANALITAVTTTDEPVVVPVLQIHAPETSTTSATRLPQPLPGDATGFINGTGGKWTEAATNTTVNAYFVTGNVPSRSYVTYPTSGLPGPVTTESTSSAIVTSSTAYPASVTTGDTGGGLHNFVRYLENWASVGADAATRNISTIVGGFIQNTRSIFATAPFSNTAPYRDLADTYISGDARTIYLDPQRVTSPLSTYRRYYQSVTTQSIPHYAPPQRAWGYDVGLLTQTPDRFAQLFSVPLSTPNEFFREVDRSDTWVQNLLCALEPTTVTSATRSGGTLAESNYTKFAITDPKQRPSTCSTLPTYLP